MRFKRILSIFSATCILGLLGFILPAIPTAAAIGNISLLTSGTIGQTISVNGTGFTSGGTYAINFDGNQVASGSYTGTSFTGSFVVPSNLPYGTHAVTATTNNGDTSNSVVFTIMPQLILPVAAGQVGDTVTLNGNGFTANSTINIYWDSGASPIATGYAGFSGVLQTSSSSTTPLTFAVPSSVRGTHYLTATDSSYRSTAAINYLVSSGITANPTSGAPGTSVTISGDGFAASATVIIQVDGTGVSATSPPTINTNNVGHFSASFNFPNLPRGSHTITALDGGGSANTTFSVSQGIIVTPASGGVGDTIGITGSGFSAGETMTFQIDGHPLAVNPSTVTSNSSGAFTNVTFTVPALVAGAHTISVADTDGNSATTTFTVVASVKIDSPSPAQGPVGTPITIEGSGFTANSTVSIFWGAAASPFTTTTAGSDGTINVTFNAPAGAAGNYNIKALDGSGNQAITSAAFTITPKIVISPASGGFGDTITVTGSGYAANSTPTLVYQVNGNTVVPLTSDPATITVDSSGAFSATFDVPATLHAGNWVIIASSDQAGNSAQATFSVTPVLSLSVTTGSAGDSVSAIGRGFAASTPITIMFGNVQLSLNPNPTSTDVNGSFTCQFSVPATLAGTIEVNATDGTNTSPDVDFTATAKATISPVTSQSDQGYVGLDMTVSGTGFAPNATVTVTFEGVSAPVASVTSDATGSFTATFKVPAASAGNHKVIASDGTTSKTFVFYMDSNPPDAPSLLAPADKFKPKQPVPFSWSAVTDYSGVTYTLQISQDPNFAASSIILEKSGLTDPTYTMTAAEKLKSVGSGNAYYWRVQAVDGAGNASAWSAPNSFTIGFLWPGWLVWLWVGLGVIVAFVLGMWLGRRMAYDSY